MIRWKHVTLLVAMAMVLVGCATVKTNYVDPAGRNLPNPHYALQVIGEPLFFTFYYTAYEEVKDLDGSKILKPTYLNLLDFNTIDKHKIKALTLSIEVNNPKGLEYDLYEKVEMKIGKGNVNNKLVQKGGSTNRSNLSYRHFVYNLPIGKDVKMVDYLVIVYFQQQEVARIGHFRYQLNS